MGISTLQFFSRRNIKTAWDSESHPSISPATVLRAISKSGSSKVTRNACCTRCNASCSVKLRMAPFPGTYFCKVLVPILAAANLTGGALDHPSWLDDADIAWRNVEGAHQLVLDVLAHISPPGLVGDLCFRHHDHFFASHIGVEQSKSNTAALFHTAGLVTDFLQIVG